ncbi:MAG TPA: MlaD family protein [Thermoleophilaceae bacterium]|nr:MlaD family protein [Thermoleophilaceae bacterium]
MVLVALILFGRGDDYKVTATFDNGGQLVAGNQVRVGGRAVGVVDKITLNDESQAVVEMSLEKDFGDLHRGTTATIRSNSLSGIANRYVSLAPGPSSAPKVASGGRIMADATTAPVDLDQLFNTLDPKTRKGLQQVIQGQATYFGGRSKDYAEALKYTPPALNTTSALTRQLVADDVTFDRFLVDTSRAMGAIAERRGDLTSLVSNANTTAGAIGDESEALGQTLELAPGTLRKGSTTFVNLRSTLDDLDVLVDESKPATKRLPTLFEQLKFLTAESAPTVRSLRELISLPGPGNDLTNLTARLPRLEQLTSTVFPRTIRTMDRSQDFVNTLRQYTPDLGGAVTKLGQVTNSYDANGHYARVQPMFTPFSSNPTTGELTLVPPSQRGAQFQTGRFRRCPGGAMQAPPDGSAPFVVPDCNPASRPD